jgi:flavin-dependent dehydrogenase
VSVDQTRLPERVDVLIVGGGMAGLAAATVAAENGARVVVVEKGTRPGGSAALSVGTFWAVPDFETLRRRVPLGDPDLGRAVVEDYPAAVEAIRRMGLPVGDRVSGVMTVGVGHSIDVHALLDLEVAVIERSGGRVACNATVRQLRHRRGRARSGGANRNRPRARDDPRYRRLPGRFGPPKRVHGTERRPHARALEQRQRR